MRITTCTQRKCVYSNQSSSRLLGRPLQITRSVVS